MTTLETQDHSGAIEDLRAQLGAGMFVTWRGDGKSEDPIVEVRATSSRGISHAMGLVPWTQPGLRIWRPCEAAGTGEELMARDINSPGHTGPRVPLALIDESPFNPRKTFDAAKLADLAADIAENGLIDPLLVRPKCGGRYELVDGARRYRALHTLPAGKVPVRVQEMGDAEAFRIMFSTQENREPLNPIDRAEALAKLYEEKGTQRAVAAELDTDQSEISRQLRLTELPEPVRELGRQSKLTAGHLGRLVRWSKWPDVCAAIAELAVEREASVRDLEGRLPFAELLVGRKVVRDCTRAKFDWRDAAKAHSASFVLISHWQSYCLDLPLWDRLQKEASQKAKEEAAAAQAEARAAVENGLALLDQQRGCVRLDQTYNQTPSCTAACPCRLQTWCRHSRRAVPVCTNGARLEELKRTDTEAERKHRRVETDRLLETIAADLRERQEISTGDLLLLMGPPGRRDLVTAAELLGLDVSDALPQSAGPYAPADISALRRRPVPELRSLLVLARCAAEQEQRIRWDDGRTRDMEWYLGIPTGEPEAVEPDEDEEAPEFSGEAICLRCGNALDEGTVLAAREHAWAMGEDAWVGEPTADREGLLLLTRNGATYCADCAPSVAICRVCGCTDEAGCESGCTWELPDLCSACLAKAEVRPEEDPGPPRCVDCGDDLNPAEGLLTSMRAGRVAYLCEGCKNAELAAAAGGAS